MVSVATEMPVGEGLERVRGRGRLPSSERFSSPSPMSVYADRR